MLQQYHHFAQPTEYSLLSYENPHWHSTSIINTAGALTPGVASRMTSWLDLIFRRNPKRRKFCCISRGWSSSFVSRRSFYKANNICPIRWSTSSTGQFVHAWTRRGEPMVYPPRSSDLTPSDHKQRHDGANNTYMAKHSVSYCVRF